mgnify:CR=1 FL=1
MIEKYTIDSPYKALYWSLYNLVFDELYTEKPEYIPEVSFEPKALSKLDGYPYISLASAKQLLKLKEVVAAVPSGYDYRSLVKHFEQVVEDFRVSNSSFVVTEENYTYLKPTNYPYQLSYSLVILWFSMFLEVVVGEYSLKIKGLSSELAESSLLYYFKLFEYISIDYTISDKDIDTINSQLYVEMARFHGYMTKEILPISKKQALFEEQGFQVGSIVFLYEKNYIANEEVRSSKGVNKFLSKVHLAKITRITQTEVQFQTYNFHKTPAAMLEDYEYLPESIQNLYGSFVEFLEPSLTVNRIEVGWDTLGINYAQNNDSTYAEHYFITKIESVYSVPITVVSDTLKFEGTVLPIEVATAFLLFCYSVTFDEVLYEQQYSVNLSNLKEQVSFFRSNLEEKLGYELTDFCKVKEILG